MRDFRSEPAGDAGTGVVVALGRIDNELSTQGFAARRGLTTEFGRYDESEYQDSFAHRLARGVGVWVASVVEFRPALKGVKQIASDIDRGTLVRDSHVLAHQAYRQSGSAFVGIHTDER